VEITIGVQVSIETMTKLKNALRQVGKQDVYEQFGKKKWKEFQDHWSNHEFIVSFFFICIYNNLTWHYEYSST